MSVNRKLNELAVAKYIAADERSFRRLAGDAELNGNTADALEGLVESLFDAVADAPHLMNESGFRAIHDILVGHFIDEGLFDVEV